jgi:signal transduction histidine kinase
MSQKSAISINNMKLAAKLIAVCISGIFAILVIDGFLAFHRQIKLYEEDVQRDISSIGHAMKELVEVVWRTDGQQRALEVINETNKTGHAVSIRWVWFDVPDGNMFAPIASSSELGDVIAGGSKTFKGKSKKGYNYYFSYIPIPVDSRAGALELSESYYWRNSYVRHALLRVIVLTAVLLILSMMIVSIFGFKMIGEPLRKIIGKIDSIGKGDFSKPLEINKHDELSELADGINEMCVQLQEAYKKIQIETEARIEAVENLRHEDRLKTVGLMASGVTHELGTPLNVISGRASMISKGGLSIEETVKSANIIKMQSDRVISMIRQLLDFARRRTTIKTNANIRQLVEETMNMLKPLSYKVEFTLTADEIPIIAKVDCEQIKQVLTNIITNSIQSMPKGGKLDITIYRCHEDPSFKDKCFCIRIKDEGHGIKEDDLRHIFEPFFTTKEPGQGTGLGLSITLGIVREHGGRIDVESEPGKGSVFAIYLPFEPVLNH